MRMFVRLLTNGRVMSAVISAVGAIVSAMCAGCKLYLGEMAIKDFGAEFYSAYNNTTNAIQIIQEEK